MGKTSDRLRELDPSRGHKTEIRLFKHAHVECKDDVVVFAELLERHFGDKRPHVQDDDVSRLIMDIALAASEEACCGEGYVSRKGSIENLRAMFRQPVDELIYSLQNCDMATFGRIQTAHAELDYRRNGIPAVEIPDAGLSSNDWGAACNGDADAYVRIVTSLNAATSDSGEADSYLTLRRGIELPTKNQPLHLPMGIDGLKQAIADAIAAAEEEAKDAVRGRRKLPHQIELAKACAMFWQKYGPRKQPVEKYSCEEIVSPRVKFTMGVFILAGIDNLQPSWISKLFTGKLPI